MNHLKKYNEDTENIDPFGEEDWDESDNQIFYDEETGFELEWIPTKKTMDGWIVRNVENDKIVDYIKKQLDREIINKPDVYLATGYFVRLKIEEYQKKLKL